MNDFVYTRKYTLEEAYLKLGLTPLDEALWAAVERNDRRLQSNAWSARTGRPVTREGGVPDRYRQIGSTTWMLVEAILELKSFGQVYIEAPNTMRLALLREQFPRLLKGLYPFAIENEQSNLMGTKIGMARFRSVEDSASMPPDFPARPTPRFHDTDWAWKARDRYLGPFALIRTIRQVDTSFQCFDEKGAFLFDLSEQGLRDLRPWDEPDIQVLLKGRPHAVEIEANAVQDLVQIEDVRLILMVVDRALDDLVWEHRGKSNDGWNDDPLSDIVSKPTPDKHPSCWEVKEGLARALSWSGAAATVYVNPSDLSEGRECDPMQLRESGLFLVVSPAVDRGKVYIVPD